jgi:hypothetical protein
MIKKVVADGSLKDLVFNYRIQRSSWIALRIYSSAHTNPVFVILNNQPVAVKKSA